jgi:hypothetical protein
MDGLLERLVERRPRMTDFRRISKEICGSIPAILQTFHEVTEQEPWAHLPADYRANLLGDIVARAAVLALDRPEDDALCRDLLDRGAEHGESRLEDGFPDSVIFQEIYLVREALWVWMRDRFADASEVASEAVVRVDLALSLAAKASLRGYHRPAFEKRGDWPGTIHRLATEWMPPPPIGDLYAELADGQVSVDRR